MTTPHPSAQIEDDVVIGDRTMIWSNVQIRRGARIGSDCVFGRNSFVDVGVVVGNCVKVQNNASLYEGVTLEDGVFVGPHVIFTNDRLPRAITPTGTLKTTADWVLGTTTVRQGASIGAGAVIVTGADIGRWAMVGAGTVVTRDIPDHGLVVGSPGRIIGYVSAGGVRCDTIEAARERSLAEQSDPTGQER